MSGYTAAPAPNGGFQSVMTPGGYGMGMGTGMGIETLLLLLLVGGGRGLGGGLFGGNGTPVTTAAATDVLIQPAFQNLQQQISTLQNSVNSNEMSEKIAATSEQIANLGQNTINNSNDNARSISSDVGAVATSLATGNFTTLQSLNGLLGSLTAQNTQNLIQGLNQTQVTNGLISNGFNQSYLSQLTGINQLEKSIDGVSREMAECCCSIKTTIRDSIDATHADGEATRALINALNVQNLQTALQDAKAQISNLSQTNALNANNAAQTAIILQHLNGGHH